MYNILSYYSFITCMNTGHFIQNVILCFLHRARIDNNRSDRFSNYISFARNCIPCYIFSSTSRIDESK